MGIADFLPRILASAGRKIDLQQYAQSIEVFHPENDDSNNETNPTNPIPTSPLPQNNDSNNQAPKRPRPWEDNGDEKQQEHLVLTPEPKQKKQKREIRRRQRPLRIGVDVSVWISKAAHGFGNMLLDERHLSNYGRAVLMEQQQHQQLQEKARQEADQTMEDIDDESEHLVESNSVVDDNQEENDNPDWKVQGTAHPRRTAKESNGTMRRRAIRLAINSPGPAPSSTTKSARTTATTTPTTTQHNNNNSGPNTEMIQNYVMTCAQYVMKRLETLRELTKADVLVVLDGKTPPIKAMEVKRRSERRNEAEQTRDDGPTLELDEEGEAATAVPRMKASRRAGAGRHYGEIVSELLTAMRQNQVTFLVAPFEADSQLAYLSNQGYIDLIITEDSDLLAHGPRSVLFKAVDPIGEKRATGILIHDRDLGAGTGSLDLTDFSTLMLAVMFVAAGCDYCEKLKGIGIVAACNIVRGAFFAPRSKQDSTPTLEKIFKSLYRNCYHKYISKESKVDFEANFMAALAMYRHPVVYDPVQRKCVVVNDPMKGGIDKEFEDYPNYVEICTKRERLFQIVGLPLDARIATHIAEGWINPKTNHPYAGVEIPTYVKYDMEQLKVGLDHGENKDIEDDDDEPDTQDVTQEHLGRANLRGTSPKKGGGSRIVHTPDREVGVSLQKEFDKVHNERADGERGLAEANKGSHGENGRAAEDLGPNSATNERSVARTTDTLEAETKNGSPGKADKSNRIQQAVAEENQSNDGQEADDEQYETAEDELEGEGDDDDGQDEAAVNPDTQMNPANAPRSVNADGANGDGPPTARPEPFVIDLMDSDSEGAGWDTQIPTTTTGAKPDTVPS